MSFAKGDSFISGRASVSKRAPAAAIVKHAQAAVSSYMSDASAMVERLAILKQYGGQAEVDDGLITCEKCAWIPPSLAKAESGVCRKCGEDLIMRAAPILGPASNDPAIVKRGEEIAEELLAKHEGLDEDAAQVVGVIAAKGERIISELHEAQKAIDGSLVHGDPDLDTDDDKKRKGPRVVDNEDETEQDEQQTDDYKRRHGIATLRKSAHGGRLDGARLTPRDKPRGRLM